MGAARNELGQGCAAPQFKIVRMRPERKDGPHFLHGREISHTS
jgi:hypothetical protein